MSTAFPALAEFANTTAAASVVIVGLNAELLTIPSLVRAPAILKVLPPLMSKEYAGAPELNESVLMSVEPVIVTVVNAAALLKVAVSLSPGIVFVDQLPAVFQFAVVGVQVAFWA